MSFLIGPVIIVLAIVYWNSLVYCILDWLISFLELR